MEDLDIIDTESQQVTGQGQGRIPVFLKVLCILTFVGSGLGILGAFVGLLMRRMTETNFRVMQSLGDDAFGLLGVDLEQMIKWQTYMNIANLIGAAMCLTGALLMWRLKKTGFYVYVPGALIPLIVSAIGMQYIMSGFMSGFGMMGVVLSGMVSAAFIIMYGVNYKHLR